MVKVGDKVRFLNEVGGGTVTRIVNKKMVDVENEDGFEIPMLISELVVIEPVAGSSSSQENPVSEPEYIKPEIGSKPNFIEGKDSPDFYLAFVPQNQTNPVAGEIEAWFVNDSNFSLLFNFSFCTGGIFKSVKNGNLGPNSKVLLESFDEHSLSELPDFHFQVIYYREESTQLYPPVVKKLKVNPVKFYKEKTFQSNNFFSKNAWLLAVFNNLLDAELDKLTDDDLKKVVALKEKQYGVREEKSSRRRDLDLVEVDLHINELVENTAGLSSHEILEVQIDRFNSEMQQAISDRVKRIVFIHGVGQGALKAEIINELKKRYKKYYFQDASFKEYGYGATMVILRKG